MKIKSTWYLWTALLLGLAAMSVSCAFVEPPNAPLPVAVIAPPNIPHRLEGRGDCRLCHATGIAGAPQFPADHPRRPSDVCLDCHRPAAGLYAANETIPWPTPVFTALPTPTSTGIIPPVTTTPPSSTTPTGTTPPAANSAQALFATNCSPCHGANRQGTPGLAPALTPDKIAGMSDAQITDIITNGRQGTAMTSFESRLTADKIAALVQFLKTPLP